MGGQWETLSADTKLNCPGAELLFERYQDPREADKLTKIQENLDDVQEVVKKSIDDLIKRGENLEELIDKSKDLSFASKEFRKQAEKNNSCFQWLLRLFT